MSRWFRWYRGTTENPKFRVAARHGGVTLVTVFAVWQVVLEDAAHPDHRGICEKSAEFISAVLDISDAEQALFGLAHVGLVKLDGGTAVVANWDKWQYIQDVKDQTATDRKRRSREGKREGSNASRPCHAKVTPEGRPDTDTEYPEPKGSGADAPGSSPPAETARPDWQTRLFREGVPIVMALTGKPDASTRQLIGRWRKVAKEDCRQVLRVIEDARDNNPADPVAWIEGALRNRGQPPQDMVAFAMMRH